MGLTPEEVARVLEEPCLYWVEVCVPVKWPMGWTQVHPVGWEVTEHYADAWLYANQVATDPLYRNSLVRIVERSGTGDNHVHVRTRTK